MGVFVGNINFVNDWVKMLIGDGCYFREYWWDIIKYLLFKYSWFKWLICVLYFNILFLFDFIYDNSYYIVLLFCCIYNKNCLFLFWFL